MSSEAFRWNAWMDIRTFAFASESPLALGLGWRHREKFWDEISVGTREEAEGKYGTKALA